ncbi:hypothetical protein [uncultured Clostridium sp.]|uniref:hypothetical protein n=1 Tax=uncultured Clostridium sp. TaxID=59620 RepID=UPI00100FD67C|nr:hypothetical protein [uncultured Clostridium sp.]
MSTYILKIDAFSAVVEAMDANDIASANEMLKILSKSIVEDKHEKRSTSYIELKNTKQINLFHKFNPTIQYNEKQIKVQE